MLKDGTSGFNSLFLCKIPQHSLQVKWKVIVCLAETWFRYFFTAALKLHWEFPAVNGKELNLSVLTNNCILFLHGDCVG